MLIYLIQVIAGIGIAWLIYRLALRKKAAARYNRFYLIGGLVLPFILPLIPLPASSVSIAEPVLLPEITINKAVDLAPNTQTPWLLYMYLGGALSLLIYHLSGFIQFFNAIHKAQKIPLSKGVFALSKANMPFSFLGRIFLPTDLSEEEQDLIVAHEQFHINRMHSLDVILGAIAHSALWFFPLMPFYLRDLRQEHEFEVDQLMLAKTGFSQYAETLLAFNLKPIHHRLFHSFSSPNLKQRIIMMTKNQKQNAWKLLLFIPLLLGLIYLNACNKQAEEIQEVPASLKMGEVDTPPQFVNCPENTERAAAQQCFNQGLMEHLIANITYPKKAQAEGIEGKVFVSITIDENGKLKNPQVVKTDMREEDAAFKEMLELAALEVFVDFPDMRAAQKEGKKVAIEYVVPINFKLAPKEENKQASVTGPHPDELTIPVGNGC